MIALLLIRKARPSIMTPVEVSTPNAPVVLTGPTHAEDGLSPQLELIGLFDQIPTAESQNPAGKEFVTLIAALALALVLVGLVSSPCQSSQMLGIWPIPTTRLTL